jgi:hypothetical protein
MSGMGPKVILPPPKAKAQTIQKLTAKKREGSRIRIDVGAQSCRFDRLKALSASKGCARSGNAVRRSSRRKEAERSTVGPPLAGGPSWDYENRTKISLTTNAPGFAWATPWQARMGTNRNLIFGPRKARKGTEEFLTTDYSDALG